jgi:hypothetical protein
VCDRRHESGKVSRDSAVVEILPTIASNSGSARPPEQTSMQIKQRSQKYSQRY